MKYRKAKCIELYDSNTSLSISGEGPYDSYLLGRVEESSRPFFKIPAFDLLNVLAAVTDVDWERAREKVHVPPVCNTHQGWLEPASNIMGSLTNYEINVFKYINSVDDVFDLNIVELEAEVVSSNLLNIYARVKWGKDGDESVYDMTYCGRFQVWWEN